MIPEPLTITGFVLGAIGFANLARQGVEALRNDTKAYRRASADLLKIANESNRLKRSIDLWKIMWGFQEETHAQYPTVLWGDGWSVIRSTIESIEDISKDMKETLTPFCREYETQKSSQTSSVTNISHTLGVEGEQRKQQRDADQELMNTQFSWEAKLNFVLSKSKELHDFIKELKDLLDGPLGLYKTSEREFFTLHQVSTSTTANERQDIGIVGMLLKQAWHTRQTSSTLFKACFPAEHGEIGLEMSLLGWNNEQNTPRPFKAGLPEYLSYYLIIPRTPPPSAVANIARPRGFPLASGRTFPLQLEVIAEPTKISSGRCRETLRDACTELDQKRTCYLQYATPGAGASAIFKIRRSPDPLLNSSWIESKLSDLLAEAGYPLAPNHTDLSLPERVQVAYRVVELAFILLGTPWLSKLESSYIMRAYAEGKEMRYRIAVISPEGEGQDSIDAQILRVGKLLQEIALGSGAGPIQDTDLAQVTKNLGETYRDALQFCYKSLSTGEGPINPRTRDQSQVIRDNPLSEFYKEVFEPLAKLYGQRISNLKSDLNSSSLSFLPTTYAAENPVKVSWGPVPYVRPSRNRPSTLLSILRDMYLKGKDTWSFRSLSAMGSKHRKEVVVYFMSDQNFRLMSEEDVPDYAQQVEIPSKTLVLDVLLPSEDFPQGRPLGKLRFEDLGPGAVLRRSRGKINELYVANDRAQLLRRGTTGQD